VKEKLQVLDEGVVVMGRSKGNKFKTQLRQSKHPQREANPGVQTTRDVESEVGEV
jgi:hypothetical protein